MHTHTHTQIYIKKYNSKKQNEKSDCSDITV